MADQINYALNNAFEHSALHECFVDKTIDMAATSCFAASVAQIIVEKGQKIIWIRQHINEIEAGHLYAPGLIELGLDPAQVILVRLQRADDVLHAAYEAVRCASLGAVLFDVRGNPGSLGPKFMRRLSLAAKQSGVIPFMLRVAARPQPTSAVTRWRIAAVPSSSLAANAPGQAVFDLTLLRNRVGTFGQCWRVEWDYEQKRLRDVAPLPSSLVSVSA